MFKLLLTGLAQGFYIYLRLVKVHVADCVAADEHIVTAWLESGYVKHFGARKLEIHLVINLTQSSLDLASIFQFNGEFGGQAGILVWEAFEKRPKQLQS